MTSHSSLTNAKRLKNDEFYTVYEFIQREVNAYLEYNRNVFKDKTVLLPCDDPEWSNFTKFFAQNFETLGLKKLISTSYAADSKQAKYGFLEESDHQLSFLNKITDFERSSPKFDPEITESHGKIFTLEKDVDNIGKTDIDNLDWEYMDGDGDFRSDEVCALRDAADFIITNPPFSLFREFITWMFNGGKKSVLIIGTNNAIHYQEVFPLMMNNELWIGATCHNEDMVFGIPEGASVAEYDKKKAEKMGYVGNYTRRGNACWLTNIEHGKRHQQIPLMTMDDNIKYSKHDSICGKGYQKYINYNAIEVPYIDAIPSDYNGDMGVPVTFMDKYCPEQFEIIGTEATVRKPMEQFAAKGEYNPGGNVLYIKDTDPDADFKYKAVYKRIIIRRKQ